MSCSMAARCIAATLASISGINKGIKFVAAGYEAATNKRLTLTGQRGPIRVTHSGPTS